MHRRRGNVPATRSMWAGPETSAFGDPMWAMRNMSSRSISSNMGNSRPSSRAKRWNSGWSLMPWMPCSRIQASSVR